MGLGSIKQVYNYIFSVYRSLNGTASHYLAADLRRSSDMPSRRSARCRPVV